MSSTALPRLYAAARLPGRDLTARHTPTSDIRLPLWLLILLVVAWILPGLIGHEPWKPDEAYSFGLVYHILQTGDWVVPTLAGEPFMEKPPLFYITAALFAQALSPWLPLHDGAHLAAGFYIALTLLFTGLTAQELYGRGGAAAALALLACLGLAPLGHLLVTDLALLAGLALGGYGLALGLRHTPAGGICLGTGAGMAFLSKGLIGPGLIGLTALVLLFGSAWRTRSYFVVLGIAAAAVLPLVAGVADCALPALARSVHDLVVGQQSGSLLRFQRAWTETGGIFLSAHAAVVRLAGLAAGAVDRVARTTRRVRAAGRDVAAGDIRVHVYRSDIRRRRAPGLCPATAAAAGAARRGRAGSLCRNGRRTRCTVWAPSLQSWSASWCGARGRRLSLDHPPCS